MPMDKLISPLSSRLTHTDTHTRIQWPVLPPNTTTPQIQRLVTFPSHWSLMENWSSTCWRASAPAFIRDHGLDNALQHLDPSTVSWMWNYFACEIARLKCGIKKKNANKTKQKRIPQFYPPIKKKNKPHNTINKTVMTTFMGEKGPLWREKWRERE